MTEAGIVVKITEVKKAIIASLMEEEICLPSQGWRQQVIIMNVVKEEA